jgi:hypothetical protein
MHNVCFRDCEVCENCGRIAKRILSPPAKAVVYEYYSENLDGQVTGKKQREELMRQRGVSEYVSPNHREV